MPEPLQDLEPADVGHPDVEDQEHRRHAGRLVQKLDRGSEQQIALGLGVRCLGCRKVGDALWKAAREAAELSPMTLAVVLKQLLRCVLDYLRADLDPRLIGDRELLRASAPADGEALGVRAVRFNVFRGRIDSVDDIVALATRCDAVAGWHSEIYADAAALKPHVDKLSKLPRLPSEPPRWPTRRPVVALETQNTLPG